MAYNYDLTSVVISEGVTTIGDSAFDDCSSLTSVTIGNSVTTIDDWAFFYCSSLTSITIPDSVTTIGYGAFKCCNKLTEINVLSNNESYLSADGVLFNKDKTTFIFI